MCCERHTLASPGTHDGRCRCRAIGYPQAPFRFWRRYPTREERIAWLEAYAQDLRSETRVVEERIADLKAAG